jgi:hypothetical protein
MLDNRSFPQTRVMIICAFPHECKSLEADANRQQECQYERQT